MAPFECPACHRPLMSADEACGGGFDEPDHPSLVQAVPAGGGVAPELEQTADEWPYDDDPPDPL